MTDQILETAFNPAAPDDERQDAMTQAQKAAMPSSVPDMSQLVSAIARANEDAEFYKSLTKPKVVPFPSRAVQEGKKEGMQSVWLDERQIQMQGEYFEKSSNFNFDSMRMMVDRTPILSAVIMTRIRQVARFCRPNMNGQGPGFSVGIKNFTGKQTDAMRSDVKMLNSFFNNCGWETNPRLRQRLKRDNFAGFMSKLVRDSLVMDSAPIECEYKKNRRLGMDGFYAVDGATIRLCNEDGYEGDNEIFALQVVQGNLRAAYTYDDLIYVPRNARTDVLQGGYGMSETELLVSTVTGFLNAMSYNQKYFDSNAIPKGLLHLSGDYSQDDLNSFKRYWNSMVKGINNTWTLPVMTSKNQESKATFEKFGVDVNEMMFGKWMTFLTSIICAVYGMAPEELNFESFTSGASTLSGSNTEEKLINSKDKGLRPLLAHFEDLFTDFIVSDFNSAYEFRWTGLDEKSQQQQIEEQMMTLTFNEYRKLRGMQPINEAWADGPIQNGGPQQAFLQGQQAKRAQEYAAAQQGTQEKSYPGVSTQDELAKAWIDCLQNDKFWGNYR
ncbi:phage portal protein [Salmonella enterica]|nr:phage portal protein [Salmonella enterica]EFR2649711.1 phage portal protein [Salmonella enterica]EFS1408060.1 phage portal protein [Salmonella enterica]EHQ8162507.1 phage portal protein [Salmonella enterica]EJZ9218160.1 phage portal protein [Salmonella enterica]